MASISIERYMYLALRALSHVDSILCQVIFSQALRIRMKAEIDSDNGHEGFSLVGMINNLVTIDVTNILAGPHLPFFFTYIPVQLTASLLFLYTLLGWSAFVALGSTLVLFPIPGYIGKLQHTLQKSKMKLTDERVQIITEGESIVGLCDWFSPYCSNEGYSNGEDVWLGGQNERTDCGEEGGRAQIDQEAPLPRGCLSSRKVRCTMPIVGLN